MKRLMLIAFLIIMVVSMVLVGCSGSQSTTISPVTKAPATGVPSTSAASPVAATPQDGGAFRIIGNQGPTGSIGIPENMRGLASSQIMPVIEPFLTVDTTGKVTYKLASSAEWSSDNKTITLKLRKAKFHDGTDFNSQVAKWNLDQRMAAKVDGTENVASYDIVDDSTIKITIKQYQNTWFAKLGQTMGMMISPDWLQKIGVDYVNWHPVGTGPFKFKGYKENDYLEYERFDGYWGDRPHLDGIKYIFIADTVTGQIAFQSKEGDLISIASGGSKMADSLVAQGFKAETTAGQSKVFIPSSGNSASPLAKEKVRQAIEYAIDRAKLAKGVGLGYYTPLYQCAGSLEAPFDPNFQGRTYDPAKAKQLLAEAGYPNGFKTSLICGQQFAGDELPAVQSYLKDIGIEADIQIVSVAKWIELETNGWPEGLLESSHSTTTDFGTYLLRYWVKPTGPNWSRGIYWNALYRPEQLETLIQQYLVIPDAAGQTAKGKEILKLIYDQSLAIPLWEEKGISILQNNVHDRILGVTGVGGNWNFTGTWLSK